MEQRTYTLLDLRLGHFQFPPEQLKRVQEQAVRIVLPAAKRRLEELMAGPAPTQSVKVNNG